MSALAKNITDELNRLGITGCNREKSIDDRLKERLVERSFYDQLPQAYKELLFDFSWPANTEWMIPDEEDPDDPDMAVWPYIHRTRIQLLKGYLPEKAGKDYVMFLNSDDRTAVAIHSEDPEPENPVVYLINLQSMNVDGSFGAIEEEFRMSDFFSKLVPQMEDDEDWDDEDDD